MTTNSFDPNWTAKVTVPVKRVGERWEFFYGGDVPVREGTLGELTISANQITDDRFQKRVSQESVVKILGEGAMLLIALSDRSAGGARVNTWPDVSMEKLPAGTTRFEAVVIGPARKPPTQKDIDADKLEGGLWLRVKGLERTELGCSTVNMPVGFHEPRATSLNHALTMLSKVYEVHRISNTGNVYERVFYQEPNGRWYPLADLREGVLAQTERTLMSDVWQQVESDLGWRPVAPVRQGRKGR